MSPSEYGLEVNLISIRDRPFNLKGGLWFFVSLNFFFSDITRVQIFFFCRAKHNFFFQNSTLVYMTKTLNQIIFFFLHLNQNIFLEKNHNPPFKLNGRSLTCRHTIVFLRQRLLLKYQNII